MSYCDWDQINTMIEDDQLDLAAILILIKIAKALEAMTKKVGLLY